MGSEHHKELGGIRDRESPPAFCIRNKSCGASGGYMTSVVVVHHVCCRHGIRDIIATARSMSFSGSQRVWGPAG